MQVEYFYKQPLSYTGDLTFEYNKTVFPAWDWYLDYYRPNYYTNTAYPNKVQQALNVAKWLLAKKKVKPKTVKDFVDLVDGILEQL